jgi:mRNA interferase MazF
VHTFVVLTVSPMIAWLGSVTAALVTSTQGPPSTHIAVGSEAGLSGHRESFVNATDLHTIPKPALRRRRGRLHQTELARVENAIRTYLGL